MCVLSEVIAGEEVDHTAVKISPILYVPLDSSLMKEGQKRRCLRSIKRHRLQVICDVTAGAWGKKF